MGCAPSVCTSVMAGLVPVMPARILHPIWIAMAATRAAMTLWDSQPQTGRHHASTPFSNGNC